MHLLTISLFYIFLFCTSCGRQNHQVRPLVSHEIAGRDDPTLAPKELLRYPVYRVKAPIDWQRIDPLPTDSIADTTKSLCEFLIAESNFTPIRITIHNFPSDSFEERIPPGAQIARWKRQFERNQKAYGHITPQAFGGFVGFLFEHQGIVQGTPVALLAWSMQIAPDHYQSLLLPGKPAERAFFKQMRADYTIKVTGPPDLIEMHKEAIIAFARSFELIQEIPTRQ